MKALLRHMYRWAATAIAVCGLSLSCQKADDTPEEPTTYEVQVEDFSTTRETMHIGGKLYLPKGRKGPGPAAIFCHGLFGSRNEQEVYARCAARVGIIAVAFDFCGGPANGSLSDGTPADNSVLTEIEDLKNQLEIEKDYSSAWGDFFGYTPDEMTEEERRELRKHMNEFERKWKSKLEEET